MTTSVTPTSVTVPPSPVAPPAPQAETETVEKVANVLVRAKSGTARFLTRFAVPVTTGALTGLLINARRNRDEDDSDVVVDESSD